MAEMEYYAKNTVNGSLFDNTSAKVERRIEQPITAYTAVVSVF